MTSRPLWTYSCLGRKRAGSLVSEDTEVFLGCLLICRGTHCYLALEITILHPEDSSRITRMLPGRQTPKRWELPTALGPALSGTPAEGLLEGLEKPCIRRGPARAGEPRDTNQSGGLGGPALDEVIRIGNVLLGVHFQVEPEDTRRLGVSERSEVPARLAWPRQPTFSRVSLLCTELCSPKSNTEALIPGGQCLEVGPLGGD